MCVADDTVPDAERFGHHAHQKGGRLCIRLLGHKFISLLSPSKVAGRDLHDKGRMKG